ncbi:serine/threonine-protein kinase [Kibdelosporangium persicum]|uniref:non-specific serine/threonine protein kinase n=1 Tax=Kibdelosporangium persicum TaxID=2698649 RepID=A0ABX2F5P7_9PSEU|nr:serine/threonine-protein kinase [Kibdelosporangium persicum]NRN66479.1 Protein kinase domain-containing protein [Kibdelosporangium persicum]
MRTGEVIAGRYRIEDAVGAGGMGKVWRATDLELRRVVALKQTSTGDGEETRREARIGAGLHHPHVISVFDVVVEGDQRWLVMEYLPARSLAEICRADGPMAPDRVARIGAQIAAALSVMHAKGMVHRDVTPANILVTDDGTAKLTDLGIAAWEQVTLTGTARTAGTPGYVAPEVLTGYAATPASDLYSLGVTLSAAVEGHPQPVGRLAGVLSTLTDPDPAHRPSAEKTAQLLQAAANGPRVSKGGLLVAVSLTVVVVLAVAFLITSSGSERTPDSTAPAPDIASRRQVPGPPADGRAALLYGVGDQINSALATELVRETPVRMLTTNYHKPGDLTKLAGWRDTMVADAYRQGYALHVIVSDWDVDDPEVPVETKYGAGCGRSHPLSVDFPRHMRTLARIFAGQADGPPLYVTMFQEVNKFACHDGAYAIDAQTTAYYKALKDRYLEVRQIIQEEAPNARVALGWDGWQANKDDPATAGGRSMFAQFADVLRASDFQSVLAKQPDGNIEQVRRTVRILGEYGPVMVAAYGNKDTPGDVVDQDMRALLTEESIAELTGLRLFAWNFNAERVLAEAGSPTLDFVKDVVRRTAREPR